MKNIINALSILFCVCLASCDSEIPDKTAMASYPTMNMVADLERHTAIATPGTYDFYINLTKETVAISTSDLVFDRMRWRLQTDTLKCYNGVLHGGLLVNIPDVTGEVSSSRKYGVNDGTFVITSLYNHTTAEAPGVNISTVPNPYIIADYNIGDRFRVRTFPRDAFYFGTSRIKTDSGCSEDGEAQYRIVMDSSAGSADVVVYEFRMNGVSASREGLIFKNLDVSFGEDCYRISGTGIVPLEIVRKEAVESGDIVINDFELVCDGKRLTGIRVSYEVEGKGGIEFEGSYLSENFFGD